jgi:DNA-binding response OmpR family regulator
MVAWKTEMDLASLQTVLILSKDREMVSIWEDLFEQRNCHVTHKSTPEDAIRFASLLRPSLIVLDLDLPHGKKLDLCRHLRTTTNGTLLLLSPSNENENLFEYVCAGVDEHIPTPVSPMALLIKSIAWLVKQEWVVSAPQY